MLDLHIIRTQPDQVQAAADAKRKNVDVKSFLDLDAKKNSLQATLDDLKHQQKQAGKERNIDLAKQLKGEIQTKQEQFQTLSEEHHTIRQSIPNLIHADVAEGASEDDNVVIKKIGDIPTFDFEPQDHQTLGENLGMIDKEKAAEVSGARFFYLKGDVALLQYAVVQYAFGVLQNTDILQQIIDEKKLSVPATPFTVVIPPLIVSQDTMQKMGRLHPKDDRYCLDADNQVFVGSAEHCLGPMHMGEMLREHDLPLRYVAYTPCFRREAGTYGKDTRGILRTHQFDKIEVESFTLPEHGEDEQLLIVGLQEYLVKNLGLPYQLINICTGDMGSMDYRQFDIETYMPGQGAYRETHTSDYMTDYQARRLNTKYVKEDGEIGFAHMNDATAFALGRILIAIIENYQQADGSIAIPDLLQPYMGGKKLIKKPL